MFEDATSANSSLMVITDEKTSTEINRLVSTQVLTLIDHSEWAAAIVAIQKISGTIQLCADYSTGQNDALEQRQQPLPTPDDIYLQKLNGGRYFSQLDLAEACVQLEVDDDAKQLLKISTHQVLFRFDRLRFGVKSAPGIFQQCIDSLIAGLDGTAAYLDDILVTGRTMTNTTLD
uniref:Reverse transcriptase domain-containing protein n=1 Tax=Haemonchus contortus TaxID=6289 RepID=A0A7I4Z4C2_HAECO